MCAREANRVSQHPYAESVVETLLVDNMRSTLLEDVVRDRFGIIIDARSEMTQGELYIIEKPFAQATVLFVLRPLFCFETTC